MTDTRSQSTPGGGPTRTTGPAAAPSGTSASAHTVAHGGHGNSIAAWTCVGLIWLGSLLMAISIIISSVWLFVVGAVVIVLAGVAGKVLSAMGFGSSGKPGH